MRRLIREQQLSCFSACLSPSSDSTRLACQTRSQFPSPHRDHFRHKFAQFNISAEYLGRKKVSK